MQHCGEPLRVHAHGHGALARTIHPLEQAARCARPCRGRVCVMPGCDAMCTVYCVMQGRARETCRARARVLLRFHAKQP
jgi:hypothetical protein